MKQQAHKRLVLCLGSHCNAGRRAAALEKILIERLGPRGPAWMSSGPLRWEIANCLSMCGAGPNLIVYPDDHEYHHLDEAALRALLDELLAEVQPSDG